MPDEIIASPSNSRVKEIVRLRQRRHRDRTGLFVVEGVPEVRRALDRPVEIQSLFVCPSLLSDPSGPTEVDRARGLGVEVVEVAEGPFRKASYRGTPDGLLAVARQYATDLEAIPLGETPLLLVVESIEKPGNLGAMMRTVAAVAGTGVIVADPTTDPFNPNVIRASRGLVFSVPLAVAATDDVLAWLRGADIAVVATFTEAVTPYFDTDLTGPVAIVVGSEHRGLSAAWSSAADLRVTIPMPGTADSLNAATAAAVVLFEALRQRPRRRA